MSIANGSAMAESGGRKRSTAGTRRRAAPLRAPVEPPPELAAFRGLEPEPAAVEMWPVEAAAWLEPELRVSAPRSGDLRLERRHTGVSAIAVALEPSPSSGGAALDTADWRRTAGKITLPAGDLALLGWDARAALQFREAI